MSSKTCPRCGAASRSDGSFCESCGTHLAAPQVEVNEHRWMSPEAPPANDPRPPAQVVPIPQSNNLFPCPDCGHMVSRLAFACPRCGRPFRAVQVQRPAPQPLRPAPIPVNVVQTKQRSGCELIAIIVIAILAAVIILMFC